MYFYSDDEEDSDDSSIVSYKSNDFEPFYGGNNQNSSNDQKRSNIKLHLYAYMYISDCDLTINSENIDKILKILKILKDGKKTIDKLIISTKNDPDLENSVESYLEKINPIWKRLIRYIKK